MLVEGRRTSTLLGVKSSPRLEVCKSWLGFGLGYAQDIVCSDIRVNRVVNDIFGLLDDLVRYLSTSAWHSETFNLKNHALRPFCPDIAFPRSNNDQNGQVSTTMPKCVAYPIIYVL